MKKVRLYFYKAQFESWTDLAISSWTWLWNIGTKPYSHVEIGIEIQNEWKCFSSSIRDGGTRWKSEADILKHPERWDVFEKEYPDAEVLWMIIRANKINGKKYDVLGILGFITVTGQVLNDIDKWYCSETCWYVLNNQIKKRISPRRMSKIVVKYWQLLNLNNKGEE